MFDSNTDDTKPDSEYSSLDKTSDDVVLSNNEVERLAREFEQSMIRVHEDDARRAELQNAFEFEARHTFVGPQEKAAYKQRKGKQNPWLVLALIGALAGGLVVYQVYFSSLTSDEILISRFHNNEKAFLELVNMAREDRKTFITKSSTVLETGLSDDRLEKYRLLIDACQAQGIVGSDPDLVYIPAAFQRDLGRVSGFEKGYLCARKLPSRFELQNNLNNPFGGSSRVMLRQIDDKWFLYRETYWRKHFHGPAK